MIHWLALLVCVVANVSANVALKRVMTSGPSELNFDALVGYLLHPGFWIGLMCAGVVLLSYLFAIRVVPLGIAYPTVTSLAMVGVAAAGAALFNEPLGLRQVIGVLLIIGGVSVLARA